MKNIIKLTSLLTLAVPFLFSCNNTNDQAILDQANKYLAEAKDSIHTCHDAVVLLGKKFTSNYTLSSGSEFVFDISSKQMVVVNNGLITKTSKGYIQSNNRFDYFRFVNVYDPNMQCSQYLKKSGIETETIYVTTGFDAGYHKDIKNLVYSNYSGNSRKITINSYFDYLTINAPDDEVNVYNEANNIIVNKVNTLNMYGSTSYMKGRSGNINFHGDIPNSLTRLFEIEKGKTVNAKIVNDGKVYSTINCDTLSGATKLNTKEVEKVDDIISNLEGSNIDYFKLTHNIIFDDTRAKNLCFDRAVCIDLNGHKITISRKEEFLDSDASSYAGITIESKNSKDCSMYIIDSQDKLDLSSGIDLINCSIIVKAPLTTEGDLTSNIAINSGVITQTVNETDITKLKNIGPAIVTVGTVKSSEQRTKATTQIFGGKILCDNTNETLKDHCGCLGALGEGSTINIDYGDIESNDYCIFGNSKDGADYGDANLIISGGKVISSDNCAIYFPLKCDMTISDCTINGKTCINANAGNITMSGSKFNASGQYLIYTGKNYDGSVIYAPKYVDDSGDLNITATSCTMNSTFAYIIDIYGDSFDSKTNADFVNGTYGYYRGNGVYSDDSTATITKGGTWNKRIS